MTEEELEKLYRKIIPQETKSFPEASEKLDRASDNPHISELRGMLCNEMLNVLAGGYVYYNKRNFPKNELVQLLLKNIAKLPKANLFYNALRCFFTGDEKKCLEFLLKDIDIMCSEEAHEPWNEADIVYTYLEPFKQGFDGFWTSIADKLSNDKTEDGIFELCHMFDEYYATDDVNKQVDILSEFIRKHPDFVSPRELMAGLCAESLKLYNNAIAYFQQVEDNPVVYARTIDVIYFWMAFSYGKLKELKKEEEYYRKTLEAWQMAPYAMNNLGYCLYKQKRYDEAEKIFLQCLEENRDGLYPANNYVRTLIAAGKNKAAKEFIAEGKYKVSKYWRERVEQLPNINAVPKIYTDDNDADDEAIGAEEARFDTAKKREQFSSEKVLEDELNMRIESGASVFGKKLKIYKRKGEYGRQYIIPIGRLDLLCEDDKGDLYIIELKKDSGYDDPYNQTTAYLDWFEKHRLKQGQKVYGIICLNNPNKSLIDKVRNDPRVMLYEYSISYTRIN